MVAAMLLANIYAHNYGAEAAIVSDVLSLNSGLFAAVCLASRLEHYMTTFALVMTSVLLFALYPALRRRMKHSCPTLFASLTVLLSLVSVKLVSDVSCKLALLTSFMYLCICVMSPMLLVWMQPLKRTLHGPWDEAELRLQFDYDAPMLSTRPPSTTKRDTFRADYPN